MAQEQNTTDANHFSLLTISEKFRETMRRWFNNRLSEVLSELYQNSRRAGANRVTITTSEEGFTVEDNGHGIIGGPEGFRTMFAFGDSYFMNAEVKQEQPMGIGIQSLFSLEQITQVTLTSGHLTTTIDCSRWWTDVQYFESWADRIQMIQGQGVAGLRIEVQCEPALVETLKLLCGVMPQNHPRNFQVRERPARGYEGWLSITCDGQRVDTSVPDSLRPKNPLITTAYEGSELLIDFTISGSPQYNKAHVNWYGQLIPLDFPGQFTFYLEVRAGYPLSPKSPTRQGIIENSQLESLTRFVKDQLFHYLFAPEHRTTISPAWVRAYYQLDRERANREAPYFVATRRRAPQLITSSHDVAEMVDKEEIFTYGEEPLLLDSQVHILHDDLGVPESSYMEESEYGNHGLSTFLPMTGEAYELRAGNPARLTIRAVWWRPGAEFCAFPSENGAEEGRARFFERGQWGLGTTAEEPPKWHDVKSAIIACYAYSSHHNFQDTNWLIGCPVEAQDPQVQHNGMLEFLKSHARAAFDPDSDDYDYETLTAHYEESINEAIRSILSKQVPAAFELAHLQRHMKDARARIEQITYLYPQETAVRPHAIIATNAHGDQQQLSLMY